MRKIYLLLGCLLTVLATQAQPEYNTTAGTGSNVWPFGSSATSNNSKVQWLYMPGDFVGGLPSGTITDIYIKTVNPIVSTTFYNLTFKMGHTALTTFSSGPFEPTDTVFTSPSFRIDNVPAEGWIRIPLDTPFEYNSSFNLVIEGSHTGFTSGITIRHSNVTAGNKRIYGNYLATTGTAVTGQMDVGLKMVNTPCGTIAPGIVTASSMEVCSWQQLTLDLTGHSTGIGQTYQWQTSTNNITWTDANASAASPYFVTSQSTATWYRALVRCGTDIDTTAPEFISVPPAVSGTFTINSLQAASPTNFQSFGDAMNHIACGINGPVVFNVAANSGPYVEQVVMPDVSGTSETNTITINGNGNTLQFAPAASARHIFQIRGADYVTINDLTIQTTDNTHGWALHLINEANHVTVKRCTLSVASVNQSETNAGNSVAFLTSSSYTSLSQGNNANHLTIDSCLLEGGYQTVYLNGGTDVKNKHNKIMNSTIRDFYVSGINVANQDSATIEFNDFNRMNRASNGSIVMLDIQAGNTNMLVNSNRLHDTHTGASAVTGSVTGIGITNSDAPVGSENKIINNLIYRFNTNGTQVGLSNNNSDGVQYYHNTVILANTTNTNSFVNTRGFYQNAVAERIDLQNNLFYINRTGAGPKHCMYFNTAGTSFTSNNNILANLSTTPATNGVAYMGSNYATLSAWQASNGLAYDQQSLANDPMFSDTAALNFAPTEPLVADAGDSVGVTNDIFKAARSTTTPDIGAIEWTGTLPVNLISFRGEKQGDNALLRWLTASEQDTYMFLLERSADGENFEVIDKIQAIGGVTQQGYEAMDASVFKQLPFASYRLKMVDITGKHTYSEVVTLKRNVSKIEVSAYPNPVVKNLQLRVHSPRAMKVDVRITTSAGVLTGSVSKFVMEGANTIIIPEKMLQVKGIYLVTIIAGEEKQVIKVVK